MAATTIDSLKHFLERVQHIAREYEKIALITGENFNIFKVLNLHSSEVRTHSAFLAELLNAHGTHGQGDLFLRLFVEQFEIENFDTENSEVFVEKYIGEINDDGTEGGRIDILIEDVSNAPIIIENKIYAGDQENQLLRYHNFKKDGHLFYLTLDGCEPSSFSTGSDLDKKNYRIISYREDIIKWLENCKKESVSLPVIRETIVQYIHLIQLLTNQTTRDKMKDELIGMIKKNPEIADSINSSHEALQDIVKETSDKFFKLSNADLAKIPLGKGRYLRIILTGDNDGVFLGYKEVNEKDEDIKPDDRNDEILKILQNCPVKQEMHKGYYWNAWCNPEPFKRRDRFSSRGLQEIIGMHNDSGKLRQLVDQLLEQEKEIRDCFLEKFKFE